MPRGPLNAKTWIVWPDPESGIVGGALVGSANLTRYGLYENLEVAARADVSEVPRIAGQVRDAWFLAKLGKDKLLEALGVRPDPPPPPAPVAVPQSRRRQRQRRGCLGRGVLTVVVAALVLFGGALLMSALLTECQNAVAGGLTAPGIVNPNCN